ncbi:hypothetical protein CHS0354_039436 [Potamilus streckersoni]|uniref:Nucleolar protein 11 n=1 Tax=Potamilus streckersoni TaxID=2493646 RepID=A0AAE0S202_9BIVA|nr:hypothetical protein CHS0354_039436 [Potamilus streckersoni]
MAALIEHVLLATFSSENEFLAVEPGNEKGLLTVTRRNKGVDVFKEADQKLVKSWSVRHGLTLTSPVKWCSNTEHFITVVNNQEIRFWDNETTDFERAKKKHINIAVQEVLVVPGWEPIVVCSNGTVGFLEKIRDGLASSTFSNDVTDSTQDGAITWCKALTLHQHLCVLLVKQRKDDNRSLTVHIHWYNSESSTWTHQTTDPKPPRSHHLHSVDCISHREDIHVYSLWSNGDIQHMRINLHSVNQNKTIHTLSGLGPNATMVMIDHTHAAVAGIKQADEEGLGIMDIKYGALQTWKPFPDVCKRKIQLSCIGECLYLCCKRALYFYKFHCPPSSVSSLLGQQPDAAVRIISTISNITWESHRKIGDKPDEVQNLYMKLLDATQTDTYTKFKDSFGKLQSFLKKRNYSEWTMSSDMVKLIERCLSEKKFWARDELAELIRRNCIPSSLVPALFEALIQHGEVALISEALNIIHDVPEKALCSLMAFILQPENKSVIETEVDIAMETDSENGCLEGLTPQQIHLIKCVLRMPFSDVFLLECLRSLAFRDVIKLLQCLCSLIEDNSFNLPEEKERSTTPSNTNIVDWLGLLIDSHMTQLVISPDAHVLLLNLHNIVQSQVEFCEELADVEALLAQLKEKSSLPQKQRVGQYCIEVLHIY